MKLIAKTDEFTRIFELTNMNGLFNPVILSVKKAIISMVGRDVSDTALTSQRFKGIKIEDGDDGKIVFDPEEMLNTLKLFKSDDEISINILENSIVVANADTSEINDVVTIPQIDIATVDEPEFPFKIVKGLPVITNKNTKEKIEFTINGTIPVKYLKELVKRANFTNINPRIYKLIFEDGTMKGVVGAESEYQKTVTTTFKIESEGSGELLFGAGMEEMIATLTGDVSINAVPEAPVWFTSKSDENLVYTLLAPAMTIEE